MSRRLFPILKVLGMVIGAFGLSMLLPLAISQATNDQAQMAYDEAVLVTQAIGVTLWLVSARCREELKPRDGYLQVVLIWTITPLLAALSLMIYLQDLRACEQIPRTRLARPNHPARCCKCSP